MKEYSIGYQELLDFPFEKFLEFGKIVSLEKKEEAKKEKKAKKKAEDSM
jgi:hypothetical protein